ncbi:endoglucanase-like [Rhynchophorus ferrugineus]|uniref:endoglucanase-like n=1 Tax=Rhynchophorus ferrugineus TaxID=354439 RepID=UPI003FCD1A96
MKAFIPILALATIAYASEIQKVVNGISGQGTTTRYWDCCKPSCAWIENVNTPTPVNSCAADGVTIVNASVHSGCDNDGTSYVCNNQQPWAVSDTLAYGFVAASFTGGADNSHCCICLKLQFQNALNGKSMVVQVINTGSDLGSNHFDIQVPGGGVGIFTRGCQTQWNAPWSGWGQQYGGVSSDAECSQLPSELQDGCHFRFNWFQNADNPQVYFEQVTCPSELTSLSGCSA